MASDRGDMRLIPGAFEIRRAPAAAATAPESRYPVMATVAGALPTPSRPVTRRARAAAALGSLLIVLALVLALGVIPKILEYAIGLLR